MSGFTFAPATKQASKARLALDGPSGSGKTYTALITATVLAQGGRVAVIDTERGSAAKYADRWTFDTLQMHTYDPRDLVKALAAAATAGYPVVVVDSLSHFWMGAGGMLEQVDHAGKRFGGNSFAGWKEARPMERALIDALLAYPGHVIVTMRTKTEWVIDTDERGKNVPRKIGTKPEQREGIEYEFDVVAEMDVENTLVVSKSRCSQLAKAVIREPGPELGQTILDWLTDGAAPVSGRGVGELLAVALDPRATADELAVAGVEARARDLLGAAVEDEAGRAWPLGDLLRQRWEAARAADASPPPEAPAAPDEPAEPSAAPADADRARQMRRMMALLAKCGLKDRDAALSWLSETLGRPVLTRSDLTADEVARAVAALDSASERAS